MFGWSSIESIFICTFCYGGTGFYLDCLNSTKVPSLGTTFLFFLAEMGLLPDLSKCKVLPDFSMDKRMRSVS